MTITLAAVFAPLAFSTGNTGKLLTEFALTVASAVVVSGFVALTLTPMMCSKLLRHQPSHGRVYNALEGFFEGLASGYKRALAWSLAHRPVIIAVFVAVAVGGGLLFKALKSERHHGRPRRRDDGLHRRLREDLGGDLQPGARDHILLRRSGAGPRPAQSRQLRALLRASEGLERAQPLDAGDHGVARAEDVRADAGRDGLPDQPALARAELPQSASCRARPTRSSIASWKR
jgi:hypothetical protein